MVYVPDPSEREDGQWVQPKKKKDKASKKQEAAQAAPVTLAGGQAIPVVLVQPGAQPAEQVTGS